MKALALLDRLTAVGLTVTVEGDRLRIHPAALLSPDLRAAVVAMKVELLGLLGAAGTRGVPQPTAAPAEPAKGAATSGTLKTPQASPLSSHERSLQRQRQRRATCARIDYYPSPEATKALEKLRLRSGGGNASNIIDRALIQAGATTPETR